jgi:hypothetical protein
LQDEDIQLLITFLHDQENADISFSSALGYSHETDNTGKVIYKKKIHDYSLFPLSDHNPERQKTVKGKSVFLMAKPPLTVRRRSG